MNATVSAIAKCAGCERRMSAHGRWWPAASSLLVGRAVDAASRWVLVILLVRACSLSDFGEWALAAAVVTPAITLLDLRLRWLIAADGVPAAGIAELLVTRLLTLAIPLSIIFLVATALPSSRGSSFLTLTSWLAALKSLELVTEALRGVCQRYQRIHRVSISTALGGLVGLAGAVYGLTVEANPLMAVWGMLAGRTLVALVWDLPSAWQALPQSPFRTSPTLAGCVRCVLWGAPLSTGALVVGLGRALPRYGLAYWFDANSVGIFTALATIVAAGDILVSSIVNATLSNLGQAAKSDRSAFAKMVRQLVVVVAGSGMVGAALAVLFGGRLLSIVYGSEFGQYGPHLGLLAVAMTFAYVNGVLQAALVACRRARKLPFYLCVSACISLFAAMFCIPSWQLVGAAVTLLAMTASTTALLATALIADASRKVQVNERTPPNMLRLILRASPTAASCEIWTRLQSTTRSITLVSYFSPVDAGWQHSWDVATKEVDHVCGHGRFLRFMGSLIRVLRSTDYQVIHLHAPHLGPMVAVASLLALRPQLMARTVYHVHSSWTLYSTRNRILCLLTMFLSRRIVVCSESAYRSLPSPLRHWHRQRLQVIPNGIDLNRVDAARPCETAPKPNRPLDIVCVAGLRPIKNVRAAIEAMRLLPRTACRLTIIGDGPDRLSLERLTRRWQLSDRVTFAGCLVRDEVYARLWQADALITTSMGEGLPVAVLEALATNTVVIASDIPPHRELDRGGEIVEFITGTSHLEVADAIRRVVSMPAAIRRDRAARGRNVCEARFSAQQALAHLDQVYESLGAGKSRHAAPVAEDIRSANRIPQHEQGRAA